VYKKSKLIEQVRIMSNVPHIFMLKWLHIEAFYIYFYVASLKAILSYITWSHRLYVVCHTRAHC